MKNETMHFYILLFICFLLFCYQFSNFINNSKYNFRVLRPFIGQLNVILETNITKDNDVLIKVNDDYYTFKNKFNTINRTIKNKTKTIDLLVNEDFKGKIRSIVIFNEYKPYYFKDFSSFESSEVKFCNGKICEKYKKYSIPNYIKHNQKNDYFNSFSYLNALCILIMSLCFSNPFMLLTYFMIFFLVFYYINYKENINVKKINPYFLFGILFLIGFLLRINDLFYFFPWGDEYASISYSYKFENIITDLGNPPLFYFFFWILIKLFGLSIYTVKILPFLFSIALLYSIWWFLKQEFGIRTANVGLFLCAINISITRYSAECRSYILQAFLSIVLMYLLFKVLRKNNKKYFILYLIFGALAINTHYYETIFLAFNFIFGIIYLLAFKKPIKRFLILNIIIFLSFVPFFIITAIKALTTTSFNSWIAPLNFDLMLNCINLLYCGFVSLLLSFVFFIKTLITKTFDLKRKIYIIYSFSATLFVFLVGVIISYFRPMLVERYLVLLIPIYLIFLTIIFTKKYKNKNIIILFLLWIMIMQLQVNMKNNSKKLMANSIMDISNQYEVKAKNSNENIYAMLYFAQIDNPYIAPLRNKDINYKFMIKDTIKDEIEEVIKNDKKALIFAPVLSRQIYTGENYTCYFNATTDTCLWKIKAK